MTTPTTGMTILPAMTTIIPMGIRTDMAAILTAATDMFIRR
jgi:hypothetical protein